MSDSSDPSEWPSKIKVSIEEYRRLAAAAAAEGMTVEQWAASTLNDYAREQASIEAHRRRHGLRIFNPEEGGAA